MQRLKILHLFWSKDTERDTGIALQQTSPHKTKRWNSETLGGGNSNIFIFTITWGNDLIWRAYFSNGLVKPPTWTWYCFFFLVNLPWDFPHISVKNFPETHLIFGSTANTGFQWQIRVLVGIPETKNVSCHPGGDWHPGWGGRSLFSQWLTFKLLGIAYL